MSRSNNASKTGAKPKATPVQDEQPATAPTPADEAGAKPEPEATTQEPSNGERSGSDAEPSSEPDAAVTSVDTTAQDKPAPVKLTRDYWDEDGNRHPKHATLNVSVATAKSLIAAGKAERNDPLPGETD